MLRPQSVIPPAEPDGNDLITAVTSLCVTVRDGKSSGSGRGSIPKVEVGCFARRCAVVCKLNGATVSSEQRSLIAALRFPDSILEVTAAARFASGHDFRWPSMRCPARPSVSTVWFEHRFLICANNECRLPSREGFDNISPPNSTSWASAPRPQGSPAPRLTTEWACPRMQP